MHDEAAAIVQGDREHLVDVAGPVHCASTDVVDLLGIGTDPLTRTTLETIFTTVVAIADGPDLGDLPTLWIHGENDPLAPYEVTADAFENIAGTALEQKVYPGAMHEIFNETNQDEVLDDVSAFLGRSLS